MELVSLGRLVLVMHLTLIGYAIGYFQSQDPHGYPDILIQPISRLNYWLKPVQDHIK